MGGSGDVPAVPRAEATTAGADAPAPLDRLAATLSTEMAAHAGPMDLGRLRRFRERLDGILHVISDAVYVLDFTGAVVYLNAAARSVFAPTDDAVHAILGAPPRALADGAVLEDEAGATVSLDEVPGLSCTAIEEPTRAVTLRWRHGERERWLTFRAMTVVDDHGAMLAAIGVVRDVTDVKRSEWKLRLLGDATAAMSRSLDVDGQLAAVVALVADRVGGHCVVEVAHAGMPPRRYAAGAEPAPGAPRLERPISGAFEIRGTIAIAPRYERLGPGDGDLVTELAGRVTTCLENALLYARAATSLEREAQRSRHLALTADIATALTRPGGVSELAQRCAETIVRHLDAAFARIWLVDDRGEVLVLSASAGLYTHLDGAHARIPFGAFKIGQIAAERRSVVSNDVASDPRVSDRDWARREGMRSFAGHPLVVGDRLVGVLGMFARRPLGDDVAAALAAVADGIALGLERARVDEERARLLREVQDADRRKDEFLAMLAHELRNPLAPVVTALELSRYRGERWTGQEVVARQIDHLVRIVDDLLDVSRITHGKIELARERVVLQGVVARAAEMMRPHLDRRRQELAVSAPAEDLVVIGDGVRLVQVVANLLSNASRYTQAGGRIDVELAGASGRARVLVRDRGAGIRADMLERIFDLFVQGERSLDRAHGGLGIGLTLVKHLVELHGGTVRAESAGPGQGSTFVVTLPVADEMPGGDAGPAGAGGGLAGLKVLVVDDNTDAAWMMGEALATVGAEVETAADGPTALAAAARWRPDVVLLDLGLPGLDGFEVARRLRAEVGLGHALLVAVSGYAQDGDRRRSREAGCDHHLAKPVSLPGLLALLEQARLRR